MNKAGYLILGLICSMLLPFSGGCSKQNGDNPYNLIPDVPVDITINLTLPQYQRIRYAGTSMYLDGGYKGVLLVHDFDGSYLAFDRVCMFEPTKDCSKVCIDSISLSAFICGEYKNNTFEKCCDSRYSLSGVLTQGPAQYSLKPYRVSLNGDLLTIYN